MHAMNSAKRFEGGLPRNVRKNDVSADQVELLQPDKLNHELVHKFRPKFLAVGGEHAVYEFPEHPGLIAKVDYVSFRYTIDWNIAHNLPADAWSEELKEEQDKWNAGRSGYLREVKEYFGAEHVLPQKWFTIKVPLPDGLLPLIYERNNQKPPANPKEAWATVSIQRRAESLSDPESEPFVARANSSQINPENMQNFKDVTNHLIFKFQDAGIAKETFLKTQFHHITSLVAHADSNPDLQRVLIDFIKRAITYSKQTGHILDLAGLDNVVFYRQGDGWSYQLVDAIYPGAYKVSETREYIAAIADGTFAVAMAPNLINTLDYARTLNGLAELYGIEDRLDIGPLGVEQLPERIFDELYRMEVDE